MFTVEYKKCWGYPDNPKITNHSKKEYDEIPLEFCANCLSIAIIEGDDMFPAHCKDCGSSQFGKLKVEAWQKLYYHRHHKHYNEK